MQVHRQPCSIVTLACASFSRHHARPKLHAGTAFHETVLCGLLCELTALCKIRLPLRLSCARTVRSCLLRLAFSATFSKGVKPAAGAAYAACHSVTSESCGCRNKGASRVLHLAAATWHSSKPAHQGSSLGRCGHMPPPRSARSRATLPTAALHNCRQMLSLPVTQPL